MSDDLKDHGIDQGTRFRPKKAPNAFRTISEVADDLHIPQHVLRFWETKRAVSTASSEQVRQPINRAGLEQWRHFEPWLDPLKKALGI